MFVPPELHVASSSRASLPVMFLVIKYTHAFDPLALWCGEEPGNID